MDQISLGNQLVPHLPYLRRYARALTGAQREGDRLVRVTLEALVTAPETFPRDIDPRLALYRMFETFWLAGFAAGPEGRDDLSLSANAADRRLSRVTPTARRALLLTAMEGFSDADTAVLLGESPATVRAMIDEALAEIARQTHARVLVIEDEPIIAMDIAGIVEDAGHEVVATAATRTEAVAAARAHHPSLVLADIQLADNSSGIDAVKDILGDHPVPVIFITAFPERLLTGEKPEPAFLITKPFQRETVRAAIAQALFFDNASLPA